MVYLKLLYSFFQVGLFGFGGGYAILPLIENQVVTINGWVTVDEFSHLVSISQMTPGAIAINAATFVGTRVAGFPGALCATFGCVLPSTIVVLLILWIYKKYKQASVVDGVMSGIRPAIVGLILSAGISMMLVSFWGLGTEQAHFDFVAVLLASAGVVLLRKTRISPLLLMALSGGIGLVVYLILNM